MPKLLAKIDLDFQRYVERRKGKQQAQSREGAAYAYAGDVRFRKNLDRRPVRMALESASGLWKQERTELRATESSQPAVKAAIEKAAAALHVAEPAVLVVEGALAGEVGTFGSDDEPVIVITAALVGRLAQEELLETLGSELGRIQNGHVLFRSAHHYLHHQAAAFVRWIVAPARLALDSWALRGDVTADRAGLLCARSLVVSASSLQKRLLPLEAQTASAESLVAALDEAAGASPAADVLAKFPVLRRRLRALKLFAESSYYRGMLREPGGMSPGECDEKVAGVL